MWGYKAIVVSALSYGSAVWARALQSAGNQEKLKKLNRLMALTMAPIRRSTPTSGLEIILVLPPLDLQIKESALKTIFRILPHNRTQWDGLGKNSTGHLRWGLDILKQLGIPQKAYDGTNLLNLNKKYTVDTASFQSGIPNFSSSVTCFTDGSKLIKNAKTPSNAGYGFGIIQNECLIQSGNGQLSTYNTVFQAEIIAIQKAAESLLTMEAKPVTIFSDSQAALASLANMKVKDNATASCSSLLNQLGHTREVTLKWVKAHVGHTWNEFADQQAKL